MTHDRDSRGKLIVVCGCMFAGKTLTLIERLSREQAAGRRAVAIKHVLDSRYDATWLATHDGRRFPARLATDAAQVAAAAAGHDVVGIDETQFFGPPICEVIDELLAGGADVVAVGIDYDTWGKPFGPFPELLERADETEILTIPCRRCGKPARLNQRIAPIVDGQLVGGPEAYEPRCRGCFVPADQIAAAV